MPPFPATLPLRQGLLASLRPRPSRARSRVHPDPPPLRTLRLAAEPRGARAWLAPQRAPVELALTPSDPGLKEEAALELHAIGGSSCASASLGR